MIKFRVDCLPIAQPRQRHRAFMAGGKIISTNYTPANSPVQTFKASIRLAWKQTYDGPPLEGPLWIGVLFLFPRPGRLIFKTRPMLREWHIKRPDASNVLKAFEDALNGLAFRDDSQICELSVRKQYAAGDERPGVEVKIMELVDVAKPMIGGANG